ncbi:MAG: ATPase [Chloroflexota bacterium]
MTKKTEFKFKRHQTIGEIDALEDRNFLECCFIDVAGELEILADTMNPKCIVLGRTGSGKSALLQALAMEESRRVIRIEPDRLALSYLSNNQVLKFFMKLEVDLDIFFRVMWRHVFVVEIVRAHFNLSNQVKTSHWLSEFRAKIFRQKTKEKARDYLASFGETFWVDTEERITEYTRKVEQELQAAVGATIEAAIPGFASGTFNLNPQLTRKLTQEQKIEIAHQGQDVIGKHQLHEMNGVIDLLEEEFLDDEQKKYYITIDRLDEKWVDDDLRYRLIRALFETVREVNNRLKTVKVIVAIREDLLIRVFRATRGATGDQIEKYRGLYLELGWKRENLETFLDRRVNQLISHQYTQQAIKAKDVLPGKIMKRSPVEYIVDRTLMSPRDVITFFNECIKAADGKATISQTAILAAEGVYSDARLSALGDEWSADYSNLNYAASFLKRQKKVFKVGEILATDESRNQFELFINKLYSEAGADPLRHDTIYKLIEEKGSEGQWHEILQELLKIFFRVSLIGFKISSYTEMQWSYLGHRVHTAELDSDIACHIHPAFWRAFGIQ